MPRLPDDPEESPAESKGPISGGGKAPQKPAPSLPAAPASRKWIIYLAIFVLGLPVFLVMFGPPAAGGWILWEQFALYWHDGSWRELSLFSLATRTVDPNLAGNLRWPDLAVCHEFEGTSASGNAAVSPSESAGNACPQLGPVGSWLLHPDKFSAWHGGVAGVFRFLPVSGLLFLLGLVSSYLLRLFSLERRPRTAPVSYKPIISSKE